MKEMFLRKATAAEINLRFMLKDIIGESLPMMEALEKAKRIARSPSTVLLLGESGTGKELFAQAIHNGSDRNGALFRSIFYLHV
jgi:arginine utilization regulatory protein